MSPLELTGIPPTLASAATRFAEPVLKEGRPAIGCGWQLSRGRDRFGATGDCKCQADRYHRKEMERHWRLLACDNQAIRCVPGQRKAVGLDQDQEVGRPRQRRRLGLEIRQEQDRNRRPCQSDLGEQGKWRFLTGDVHLTEWPGSPAGGTPGVCCIPHTIRCSIKGGTENMVSNGGARWLGGGGKRSGRAASAMCRSRSFAALAQQP